MKLFKLYNNWFAKIVAVLLVLASISIFFTFKYLFDDEMQEQIQHQKKQILSQENITFNAINNEPIEGVFSEIVNAKAQETTSIHEYYDTEEREQIPFIETVFYKPYQTTFIRFTIRKSTLEFHELLYTLVGIIVFVFMVFMVALYFLNRKISSTLFAPFFNTIMVLKRNQTFANQALQLPNTDIEEFSLLNSTLNNYDENLRNEYKKAAQFTDNSSHELQTPIAVIGNRIESILGNTNTDENTKKELAEIFDTVQQMKQTNETLLLLSRLESKSFKDETTQNLTQLLQHKIKNYKEFGLLNAMTIEINFGAEFSVTMNKTLAIILIDNLLSNAIKHNIENGFIKIESTNNHLTITNAGLPLNKPSTEMFNRFERSNIETSGIGLGLSIVKEICSLYNLKINYTEIDGVHVVNVSR